ncbi:MAG: hypothetical protein Q7T01_00840 [bacterium]|nr:hypothetical protein [bacterium]
MPSALKPKPARAFQQDFRIERLLPMLTPIVVLAIGLIGYIFLLRPLLFELRTLELRRSFASDIAILEQRLTRLTDVRDTFERELSAAQPVIDSALPSGEDLPGLLATIDAAGQRSGAAVASVEIAPEAPSASLERVLDRNGVIRIGLGVRNVNYERLKSLVAVLTQSRRLIDVRSIQFTPERLQATLTLRAYAFESP